MDRCCKISMKSMFPFLSIPVLRISFWTGWKAWRFARAFYLVVRGCIVRLDHHLSLMLFCYAMEFGDGVCSHVTVGRGQRDWFDGSWEEIGIVYLAWRPQA